MSSNAVGVFQHLVNATRYSIKGLIQTWSSEAAFRYEIYVSIVALPTAWILGRNAAERALLIGSVVLILVVELVNSAIEAVVNRVGPERHELSGRAKDTASAAVFCSIILATAVWLTILFG